MSRVPRSQEHLKTGFISEAASAARYRAYAERAREESLPRLAERLLELAAEKDELAALLLGAAEQVRSPARAVADALAEERYENGVLYPKMMADVDAPTAAVFARVVAAQERHAATLESLQSELQAATADVT